FKSLFSAWFAASVGSVCCAESAGKPPGFLDLWSQYIIYFTILNSGQAVAQFPKSGLNRNRTLMSGNGGFRSDAWSGSYGVQL
ncbi:hypothetical protein NQZ68_040020, partial [Dissostichus eleginoides]